MISQLRAFNSRPNITQFVRFRVPRGRTLASSPKKDYFIDAEFVNANESSNQANKKPLSLVAEIMTDNANDFEAVQEETVKSLASDPIASSLLGEGIRYGPPLQPFSSTTNENGVMSKFFAFFMSVQGDQGVGSVRVLATVKGATVNITETVFQGPDGKYYISLGH
jgi:hypothetical protein